MRLRTRSALLGAALAAAVLGSAPPAGAVIVERVVAIIGDKPILLSDLRARAKPFLIQIQQRYPAGAQQAAAQSQLFKEMLEHMIDEELEAQAAEKAHVVVTAEEVDNAFKNIAAMKQMTVAQVFADAKEKSGLSEQDYRDEIRREIREGKMIQLRVKGHVRITEEDVKTEFDRTVREERARREYRPAWIVLRVMPGASPESMQERRELAEQLARRAREGEDFATLAKKYSDDTETRDAGGDIGIRAPRGSEAAVAGKRPVMDEELEKAVMALEPGQVADPTVVPDEKGGRAVVVIKLLSRQPSRYTTLKAAQQEMIARLQTDILEKAKRKWLDELKRRTHIDVRL